MFNGTTNPWCTCLLYIEVKREKEKTGTRKIITWFFLIYLTTNTFQIQHTFIFSTFFYMSLLLTIWVLTTVYFRWERKSTNYYRANTWLLLWIFLIGLVREMQPQIICHYLSYKQDPIKMEQISLTLHTNINTSTIFNTKHREVHKFQQ